MTPIIPPSGVRRSFALFQAFRAEQSDPDGFYRALASDTARQLSEFASIPNSFLVDVGGGAGYFSEKFSSMGATCVLVEPEALTPVSADDKVTFADERERHHYLTRPGRLLPERTIAGDGMRLPFGDAIADIAFSSNVLEHVPDPHRFIDESLRITKPGGTVYVSYTVWSSPWGGHETSPWHLLGGHYAAKRFERKHGRPPDNLYGTSLFRCRVRDVMRLVNQRDDVERHWAFPRYYPIWAHWVIYVPVLRELVTWNLVVVMRKKTNANWES